ncbi:MAG: sensor histidine kinase [Desulforhopalus sp.]
MAGKILFENDESLLAVNTFKALYHAPIPVIIACEDGNLPLVNCVVRNTIGLPPDDDVSLASLIGKMTPYPSAENTLHSSFFFRTAERRDTIQVMVKPQHGEQLVWQFYTVPLSKESDVAQINLCIAQDITDSVAQQKYMESLMDTLEQQVSVRTKKLNSTIARLESEITEKNRISDALTFSRERLKKISRHTLDILEADRQTISKELHDSIGASLAAIKFSLEGKEMERSRSGGWLKNSLQQEIVYLAATIKETKQISANLRPSTLDELGLVATIAWYVRQFQRLYGDIAIEYSSEISEKDVPEAMKINIYRIIQEGLTNAERHSKADRVWLSMKYCDGNRSLSLSIRDNGCGFNIKEMLSPKDPLGGYGLIAMRERCEIFGGFFHLDSQCGKGTRINAILPLR